MLLIPVAKFPPVSTTLAANLPPLSTRTVANFATGTVGVVNTSGKFTTSVRVLVKERDEWLRRGMSG